MVGIAGAGSGRKALIEVREDSKGGEFAGQLLDSADSARLKRRQICGSFGWAEVCARELVSALRDSHHFPTLPSAARWAEECRRCAAEFGRQRPSVMGEFEFSRTHWGPDLSKP